MRHAGQPLWDSGAGEIVRQRHYCFCGVSVPAGSVGAVVEGEVADTDVFIGVPGGVAVTGTVKGVSAGNGRMFFAVD